MPFQFSCPQGHVLQGDETRVGQPCQCPYCGSSFLVPPPLTMPAPGGFPAGPYMRPSAEPPMQPFQPPGMASPGLPVAPRPQFEMPRSQSPPGMMPAPGFPAPGFPAPVAPQAPQVTPQAAEPAANTGSAFDLPPAKPFDLGFDPREEKARLPFDFPESNLDFPSTPPPSDGFPFELPGAVEEQGSSPADDFLPGAAEDQTAGYAPADQAAGFPEAGGEAARRRAEPALPDVAREPDVFHIPCPSGHVVTITRDLLGKTAICSLCRERFQLRYEKSLEHQEKMAVRRDQQEQKVGQVWLAWSIAAAVLVLILVIVLAFTLGR